MTPTKKTIKVGEIADYINEIHQVVLLAKRRNRRKLERLFIVEITALEYEEEFSTYI